MSDFQIDNIDLENTAEPGVVKEVVKEINKIGANTKKLFDGMRSDYEKLKSTIDNYPSDDPLTEEKITKLTEDISTKQTALDKKNEEMQVKLNERIDSVEVALQRMPSGGASQEDLFKYAKDFQINAAAVLNKNKGISFEDVKDENVDSKAYQEYCKAFDAWLRKYGGSREYVLNPDQIKALSVGVDPDGGYTVTPAMSSRIIERVRESDPIRQLASIESITTDAIEFMVDRDEAGWGWETETSAGAETDTPRWERKRISVHIMYAKPRATQQLLEDSGINAERWLADKVAERFSRGEAASFVTGDGIGKPRGFLTYPSGTSYGQVEQVNMGAAAALTADGFTDVKYAMTEYYLERGTWLMNRTTVQAAMKLKDGQGNYLWKPSMIASDPTSAILNLPVRMSTTMPTVAANALSVVLADWKESYLIVDRLGITVQRDPYTVKPFIEFYTRKRVGGDLVNYESMKIGKIAA